MISSKTDPVSKNTSESQGQNVWTVAEVLFIILIIIFATQSCLFLRADGDGLAITQLIFVLLTVTPPIMMLTPSGLQKIRRIVGRRGIHFKLGVYYTIVIGSVSLVREIGYPEVNPSVKDLYEGNSVLFDIAMSGCAFTLFAYTLFRGEVIKHCQFYWKDLIIGGIFMVTLILDKYSFGLFLAQVKFRGDPYFDLTVFSQNLLFMYLYVVLPLFLFLVLRRFPLDRIGWKISLDIEDVIKIFWSFIIILSFYLLVNFDALVKSRTL